MNPLPGDIDTDLPFNAAVDALLTSVHAGQVRAFAHAFAAHEAFMARLVAKHGHTPPVEAHTPRHEVALALLRSLRVTDAAIDAARRAIESGAWEPKPNPSLTVVQ